MDRETALDKIQKLLAIGHGSPFRAEAESALAKAQRLMLEHSIELAEVEAATVGGGAWVAEDVWTGKRRPWESEFAESLVLEFFFCRVLHVSRWQRAEGRPVRVRSVQFFGDREHVAVARYAYVFLCRTFRDLWAAYRRRTGAGQGDCRAYYLGLTKGFADKLQAERDAMRRDDPAAGGALVRIGDRLDRAFREQFPDTKSAPAPSEITGDASVYRQGREDGAAIDLRTPIAADGQKRIGCGD